MKKNIKLFLILFLTLSTSGFLCTKSEERKVTHIILVWFNDSEKPGILSDVMAQTISLSKIPQVKGIHIGQPIASKRDIVDSTFDLGIEMKFNSKEDMDKYLENPLHTEFFNNYIKGKTRKIVVYDF